MVHGYRAAGLALALTVACVLVAEAAPPDPDLAKGIQQIDDGDYDAAIMTLDAVVRRLAADPRNNQELSEAYLYMGIAFLGKGHEAAAKAKFREAVKQVRELTLSPEKFSPRVIGLLEDAKAEEQRATPRPRTPGEARKGGGSRKLLILGGVAVAAGGGAAIALSGGGDADGSCTPVQETRQGILAQPNDGDAEIIGPAAREDGPWTAEIEWRGSAPLPNVDLFANDNATSETLATGDLVSSTDAVARRVAHWNGRAGVVHRIAAFIEETATSSVSYTLSVSGPCRQ